jgi:hypothetical protein
MFLIFIGGLFAGRYLFKNKRKMIDEKLKALKTQIFWGIIIDSLILQFIMNLVVCKLTVDIYMDGGPVTKSQLIQTAVMLIFLFMFPCVCSYVLESNREKLHLKEYRDKFGVMYLDINLTDEEESIHYFPIFVMRRYVFILLPCILPQSIQIPTLTLLSSLYIIFYGNVHPHISR